MKISELIAQLQGVQATSGDLNVFVGDMEAPTLEENEPVDREDRQRYGDRYLFISGKF